MKKTILIMFCLCLMLLGSNILVGCFENNGPYKVKIESTNVEFGTVDISEVKNVEKETEIFVDGSTIVVSGAEITATPMQNTAEYSYIFSGWEYESEQVLKNMTIKAKFERFENDCNLTLATNNAQYGKVYFETLTPVVKIDDSEILKVPSGSELTSHAGKLAVLFENNVLAYLRASANDDCFYLTNWSQTVADILENTTVTANFDVKSASAYPQFNFVVENNNAVIASANSTYLHQEEKIPKCVKIDSNVYQVVEIKDDVFRNNSFNIPITKLTIPNTIKKIGRYAFALSYVSNIVFEENSQLEEIGFACFQSSRLVNITLPDSLLTIGDYAFDDTLLEEVNITKNVTTLGSCAFRNCANLETVTYDAQCVLTSIGSCAFMDCIKIVDMTFPDSVTTFEEYAFKNCTGLDRFYVTRKITSIGENCFYGCKNMIVEVDPYNTVYDSREQCRGIVETATNKLIFANKNTTIATTVTELADYLFYDCNYLTTIDLKNVTKIGNHTFGYSTYGTSEDRLSSINLKKVTWIGEGAFQNCQGLKVSSFCTSLEYVGANAFSQCGNIINTLTLPTTLTYLGNQAFYNCSFTKVTIEESNAEIIGSAFLGDNASVGTLVINNTKLYERIKLGYAPLEDQYYGVSYGITVYIGKSQKVSIKNTIISDVGAIDDEQWGYSNFGGKTVASGYTSYTKQAD